MKRFYASDVRPRISQLTTEMSLFLWTNLLTVILSKIVASIKKIFSPEFGKNKSIEQIRDATMASAGQTGVLRVLWCTIDHNYETSKLSSIFNKDICLQIQNTRMHS